MTFRPYLMISLAVLIFGGLGIYSKTPDRDEPKPAVFHNEISGTYETSRGGTLYLQVDERGRLEGFYERGEQFGEVYGRLEGRTLLGFWLEDDAGLTCERARHDASGWGRLRWTFVDDTGFTGAFNYCGEAPDSANAWNGLRVASRRH